MAERPEGRLNPSDCAWPSLRHRDETERVASRVGEDTPRLRPRIHHPSQRRPTGTLNRGRRSLQVVDQEIEVHLLLTRRARPRRGHIALDAMEREPTDRFPLQSEPVIGALGWREVQDLLPERGHWNGIVALEHQLRQDGHHEHTLATPPRLRGRARQPHHGLSAQARQSRQRRPVGHRHRRCAPTHAPARSCPSRAAPEPQTTKTDPNAQVGGSCAVGAMRH